MVQLDIPTVSIARSGTICSIFLTLDSQMVLLIEELLLQVGEKLIVGLAAIKALEFLV